MLRCNIKYQQQVHSPSAAPPKPSLQYLIRQDSKLLRSAISCGSTAVAREFSLPIFLDAIHLPNSPLQRQFPLLQSLQRFPPRSSFLTKLWFSREWQMSHSQTLPLWNKAVKQVMPFVLVADLGIDLIHRMGCMIVLGVRFMRISLSLHREMER